MLSFVSLSSVCLVLLALVLEIQARPYRHIEVQVDYERVVREHRIARMNKRQVSAAIIAPTAYNGSVASTGFALPTGTGTSNYTAIGSASPLTESPNYGTAVSTVTTTISLYESYGTTVYKTLTTTLCSAVISAFSTSFTVSDCDETITFSTATVTSTVALAAIPTTVISYYAAPWHSLSLVDPTEITIVSCAVDASGNNSNCQEIREIWEVRIINVQVVSTSTVTVTQTFDTPAVITMGSQVTSVSAGTYTLSTEVHVTTTTTRSSISIAAQESVGAVGAVANSNKPTYKVVPEMAISACGDDPTIMTTTLHSTVYDTQVITTVYFTDGALTESYEFPFTMSFSTVFNETTSTSPISVYFTTSTSSTEPTTTITLHSTITRTVTVTPTRTATGTAYSTGIMAPSGGNSTGPFPTAPGTFRRKLFWPVG